jgi:hypothetical protein
LLTARERAVVVLRYLDEAIATTAVTTPAPGEDLGGLDLPELVDSATGADGGDLPKNFRVDRRRGSYVTHDQSR